MPFDSSPYDLMKKSKNQEALNKKNNTISTLQTQQGSVENAYKDLADTLAKRKEDLSAKNVIDNQNYDTQLVQGNEKFMNQRDQGVIANTNNSKAIMDWYAKNNIANSTASADELGRQATTLSNTLGTINSNKNQFETGVANDRNLTNINYNSGLNDLTNQDNAAQREKAQKIAEILNAITNADNTYNSELQSINDSVNAQQLQDYNSWKTTQDNIARQQAAASRTASARSSAAQDKANKEAATNSVWDELHSAISMKNGEDFLRQNRSAIINNLGAKTFNDMLDYVGKYQYTGDENRRYVAKTERMTPDTYY